MSIEKGRGSAEMLGTNEAGMLEYEVIRNKYNPEPVKAKPEVAEPEDIRDILKDLKSKRSLYGKLKGLIGR